MSALCRQFKQVAYNSPIVQNDLHFFAKLIKAERMTKLQFYKILQGYTMETYGTVKRKLLSKRSGMTLCQNISFPNIDFDHNIIQTLAPDEDIIILRALDYHFNNRLLYTEYQNLRVNTEMSGLECLQYIYDTNIKQKL